MVLGFDDALALVSNHATGGMVKEVETVDLLAAQGRVLAEDIVADRDQPPFDRATRDGFAVREEDVNAGRELTLVGSVRAGERWIGAPLAPGTAIATMTGAPVPPGADAVLMVEHGKQVGGMLRPLQGRTLQTTENIVARGAEAAQGAVLVRAGTLAGAAEIALAAACGQGTLVVRRKPKVAIVATGDELVELGEPMEDHQIRNSNSYALAALIEATGAQPVRLPIARDERGAVLEAIGAARGADLLILSGGVSMGEYDLVEAALDALGAEFLFTGVKMQPGKPVVFGRLPATLEYPVQYFFGLPGNPVSTQVTFHVLVAPLLRAVAGAGVYGPSFVLARLEEPVVAKAGLTRLLPGRMTGVGVSLVGWQGSGDLAANARANCYVLLEDGVGYEASDAVRVLLR